MQTRMRHWISVLSGNMADPAGLMRRPEIVSEGYAWLRRQAEESASMGLEPLLHCPLGCPPGSIVPTSIGPQAPLFPELAEGLNWLKTMAVTPSLFIGMRFHDPASMVVPPGSRWIDPSRCASDRALLEDNLRPWARMGVRHVVFDNSSPNLDAWRNTRQHLARYFNMTCEVEGMTFNADGTVDGRQPSVHTDAVMDRSHPNAVVPSSSRAARVCVQWGPSRSRDQVIESMLKWASRGFVIDYQGRLDPEVLKAWKSVFPADWQQE